MGISTFRGGKIGDLEFFMHRSYNPFVAHKDALTVVRDNDSRYLGNQMFWQYMDRIPPKHLYRPATVEYRSFKVIFLESFVVVLLLIFLAIYVPALYSSTAQLSGVFASRFWYVTDNPVSITQVYGWLRDELVPGVYSHSTVYADVAEYLQFPQDWLLMNRSVAVGYPEEEGLFDVSEASTGWDRRLIGAEPSENLLLLGSVRLREISLLSNPPEACHLGTSPCYSSPLSESASLDESRFSTPTTTPFIYSRSNITLEPSLSLSRNTLVGSGYVYDLALNKSDTLADISALESAGWIAPSSRALIVEISLVNSRINTVVSSVEVFIFDGSGLATLYTIGPLTEAPSPETMSAQFTLFILVFVAVSGFALFNLFILLKQGPVNYFSSWWNVLDLVTITLLYIMIAYILDPISYVPSALSSVYSVVPNLFVPQITYLARSEYIRTYLSVLSVMLFVRAIKCLTLIGDFRTSVKLFEKSVYQLAIFLPIVLLATTGIILGSFVILNQSEYGVWETTTSSFYVFIVAAARSLPHQVIPTSLFSPNVVGAVFIYVGLAIVTWVIVPGVIFGLVAFVLRTYTRELNEALALIEADKSALYPPGIARERFWHRDVTRVFLFTWFHRLRGYEFIVESEEEVGTPDEQFIEIELLPSFIQEKWIETRARLVDMFMNKGISVNKSLTKMGKRKSSIGMYMSAASSFLGALKSGSTSMSGLFTSNIASAKEETKISRIQLQRLLDSDPSIVQKLLQDMGQEANGLRTIRALDLIRKYKSREAVNRKMVMDHLIGEDASVSRPGALSQRGLMRAIDDIDSFYRGEVFSISETCSDLSKDLVELKSALDGFKFRRTSVPEMSHRPINPPR